MSRPFRLFLFAWWWWLPLVFLPLTFNLHKFWRWSRCYYQIVFRHGEILLLGLAFVFLYIIQSKLRQTAHISQGRFLVLLYDHLDMSRARLLSGVFTVITDSSLLHQNSNQCLPFVIRCVKLLMPYSKLLCFPGCGSRSDSLWKLNLHQVSRLQLLELSIHLSGSPNQSQHLCLLSGDERPCTLKLSL